MAIDNDFIEGGATIWARKTTESEVFYWKPDKWFKIWFYLVNRVNHADNRVFKRGSAYVDYKEIMLKTKATYGMVEKFIKWAKQANMLSTHKSTRGNIITILNYALFQDIDNYRYGDKIEAVSEAQSKHNRSKVDAINNNDKNEENEKKIHLVAKPPSDHQTFIKHFTTAFTSKCTGKYNFTVKDGAIVKRLLKQYGLTELTRLADLFFDSDDEFIQNAGYSIGCFSSQINKLLSSNGGNKSW